MFQKSFYIFQALKKKSGQVVFYIKIIFPLFWLTKSFQIFYEPQYIPQEGIHVFKTFKN
jgi:hypothetical protein